MLSDVYTILFGWLPSPYWRVAFAGLFTIAIIFIVIRIVKLVLEAIPFL